MPDIIPVELTLTSGRWYTLYQRGWDDADDDSLAFLGRGHQVFAFPTPDELAAWAGAHEDHHLGVSPLWPEVRARFPSAFEPAAADHYDLVAAGYQHAASAATREVVSDLLHQLGIDLRADPVTDWHWLLARIDAGVDAPPPGRPAAPEPVVTTLDEVAPGVEALWLGLDGSGGYTLVHRDDEGGTRFLGGAGTLVAAPTTEALSAYVRTAPPTEAWLAALRGRDVDYEPYEDNVVDLDELGGRIAPGLDRADAQALLATWPLLHELATWLGVVEVHAAFTESEPLGRFFVRDLMNVSSGVAAWHSRLADADLRPVRDQWENCLAALSRRISWLS